MIIGRTSSADGGFRRIPIRHTQIVDEETRLSLLEYLKQVIHDKCQVSGWVGTSDLYPHIPEDIIDTPLVIIYDKCKEKFENTPQNLRGNILKYLGMLVREAVYTSDVKYYEELMGSVRKYSLESKNLSSIDYKKNWDKYIYGRKK